MILTDGERAYLQLMVYQAAQGLFCPNTVVAANAVPNYQKYDDLVALATPEIQRERDWWNPTETCVSPVVPFPWASPKALHERAEEMRQSLRFGERTSRVSSQ